MDDLDLALRLADQADDISLPRFRRHDFRVSTKPDLTPVTDADQAIEQLLREQLGDHRPADSFFGEEFGSSGESARRWIVDPIDGTKNFVRGVPVFASLISLYDGHRPLLGVVSAPALGMRWFAAAGQGAFRALALGSDAEHRSWGEPEPLHVSDVDTLADASLSYSSLSGWAAHRDRDRFLALTDAVWRTRAYGDFWSYMMVAEGTVDAACEPELELYDMAALVPIVTEAGGTFTDLTGQPGPFGANGLATNTRLHKEILTYV